MESHNGVQPLKRGRHSHRCPLCTYSVACYKGGCKLPQRLTVQQCSWCCHGAEGQRWLAEESARELLRNAPKTRQDTPAQPVDLQHLAREIDALADARHAETMRLQQDADAKSLTFGAPRNVRKLRPARNLSLFVAEAQPTLF